jgi:putative effector of murein hydrolase
MNFFDKIKLANLLRQLYERRDFIMKNWKTTLSGIITASGVGMIQSDDPTVQLIGKLLAVIGPVLFGFFAKDNNVTGGTVAQNQGTTTPASK